MEAQTLKKWYNQTWLVILFSLTLFPISIFVLWKNQTLKKLWKVVIALCSPFSTALLIIIIATIYYDTLAKKNDDTINQQQGYIQEQADYLVDYTHLCEEAKNLAKEDKLNSAIILLDKATKIPIDDKPSAYIGLGLCYIQQEKFELSLKNFTIATTYDSTKYLPFYYQGKNLFFLKEYRSAVEKYNLAIQLNCPPQENVYALRGSCYQRLENYDLAIDDFNVHLRYNPNDAGVYSDRGKCYGGLSKWNLALEDFKRAIALDPKNEKLKKEYELAKQFANLGNYPNVF